MFHRALIAAGFAALLPAAAAVAGNDCKVEVCHYPPGNPANVHVIEISPEPSELVPFL